jgi:hypothetical protein
MHVIPEKIRRKIRQSGTLAAHFIEGRRVRTVMEQLRRNGLDERTGKQAVEIACIPRFSDLCSRFRDYDLSEYAGLRLSIYKSKGGIKIKSDLAIREKIVSLRHQTEEMYVTL